MKKQSINTNIPEAIPYQVIKKQTRKDRKKWEAIALPTIRKAFKKYVSNTPRPRI